jgi:hypothetical protein
MDKTKALIGIGLAGLLLFLLLRKVNPPPPPGTGSVSGYVAGEASLIAAIIMVDGKVTTSRASDGYYRIDGLAPGDYTLHAESPLYVARDYQVTIVAGEITHLDIALSHV